MKKLIMLLLALSPLCLKAQTNGKTDSAVIATLPNDILYIVDGKETGKADVGKVKNDDILDVTVLKNADAEAKYGTKGDKGVLVITTKKYAITQYQEKISAVCDEYESFLTGHGTDDAQIVYYIDGVPLAKDKDETGKLFHLPKDKIDAAVFVQDEPEGSKILAKIKITTEK